MSRFLYLLSLFLGLVSFERGLKVAVFACFGVVVVFIVFIVYTLNSEKKNIFWFPLSFLIVIFALSYICEANNTLNILKDKIFKC